MCYTYDELGRVTERVIKNLNDDNVLSSETFSYDAAGNIIGAPDGTFEYDTNNRLVSYKGQNIIYDLDGNMCLFDYYVCEYDSANRLTYTAAHNYVYNAEDVRILNNDGVEWDRRCGKETGDYMETFQSEKIIISPSFGRVYFISVACCLCYAVQ